MEPDTKNDNLQNMLAACEEAIMGVKSIITQLPELNTIAQNVVLHLKAGNKILVCGNGGSATQAQHFATELVGRYTSNRRSLPAISLASDGAVLTCIANNFGNDRIFSRQIEGLGQREDVLIAISTSGRSESVRQAIIEANNRGLYTVALLGRDGGTCAGLAHHEIIVRREATARIQETHLFCLHMICDVIEKAFSADV